MSIEKIEYAPELQGLLGKYFKENSFTLIEIEVGLNPGGLGTAIGANGAKMAYVDHIMGKGWLERFGKEVGAALEKCSEFYAVCDRRLNEFAEKAMERVVEDLRGGIADG